MQRSRTILDAEAIVRSADLRDLLVAMAGEEPPELDVGDGVERLLCPRCQGAGKPARILYAPAAEVLGDAAWRCVRCPARGTWWSARRRVLESVDTLDRLIEYLGEPA